MIEKLIPLLDKIVNFGIGAFIVIAVCVIVVFGFCITFFIKLFKDISRER